MLSAVFKKPPDRSIPLFASTGTPTERPLVPARETAFPVSLLPPGDDPLVLKIKPGFIEIAGENTRFVVGGPNTLREHLEGIDLSQPLFDPFGTCVVMTTAQRPLTRISASAIACGQGRSSSRPRRSTGISGRLLAMMLPYRLAGRSLRPLWRKYFKPRTASRSRYASICSSPTSCRVTISGRQFRAIASSNEA